MKDLTLKQLQSLRLAHSNAIDGRVVDSDGSSDISGKCGEGECGEGVCEEGECGERTSVGRVSVGRVSVGRVSVRSV